MKTNKLVKILMVALALLLSACGGKYEIKTIIYKDGSCLRTLVLTRSDSIDKDFFELDHPFPMDSSWNLVSETDTSENGDTIFVYKASRLFENVDQMNQLYINDTGKYSSINRKIDLNKKFRWFYTFLDYKESYYRLFDQPGLINYMDSTHYKYAILPEAEQEKYLKENFDTIAAKQFDSEAEDGFLRWIEYTIIYSCMDAINESVKNMDDDTFLHVNFTAKRDSITNLMDEQFNLFENDEDVFVAVKRVFGIDSISFHKLEQQEAFKKFNDKYRLWEDIFINDDIVYSLQMPGLIIETNSTKVSDDNEVKWNVGWMKYFTDDYGMHVQSRIVNGWAFWASGGLIALLILVLIFRSLYKKKK